MRLVFATTGLPQERRNGGEIASMNFIDSLRRLGHDVAIVGYTRLQSRTPEGRNMHSAGPWPIEKADAGVIKALWALRAIATGRPVIHTKFISRAYLRVVRAAAQGADLLLIDHAHMGWLAEARGLPLRRIFVAHNVEASLYAQTASNAQGITRQLYLREARVLAKAEYTLLAQATQTWCLSAGDRDGLAALCPAQAPPLVFSLPGQDPPAEASPAEAPAYDIGLIGSWNWDVNRQGVDWFVEQVLPLLPEGLRVAIAGAGSETLALGDRRVVRLGRVPDAFVFMKSCRALAVPTLVGSGVQLKTIEGIAAGVPLVATPLAMRGILAPPAHVTVKEDPTGFAAALVAAQSLARPDRLSGRDWVSTRRTAFDHAVAEALEAIAKVPAT